jgi:hypothetical protein
MNIEDQAPKEDETYVLFCGSLITPSHWKIFRPRFPSPISMSINIRKGWPIVQLGKCETEN